MQRQPGVEGEGAEELISGTVSNSPILYHARKDLRRNTRKRATAGDASIAARVGLVHQLGERRRSGGCPSDHSSAQRPSVMPTSSTVAQMLIDVEIALRADSDVDQRMARNCSSM